MAHFAQIDENNVVTRVLVIDQETIDTGEFGDPATWIQGSYNTRGGVYYDPATNEPAADQSKAFRKNYPGVGYTYDAALDGFILPRPELNPSWIVDEFSGFWRPPADKPTDTTPGMIWVWDEGSVSWVEVPDPNIHNDPESINN